VQECERVSGSDVGTMDPLVTLGARDHHALLMDFAASTYVDIAVPPLLGLTVVHSEEPRTLSSTAYATRRRECDVAEEALGGWDGASRDDVERLRDETLRRRARHVVSENDRVREFIALLENNDVVAIGDVLNRSHQSLRDDFDVSTGSIDDLVHQIVATPGAYGARLVGGGFGGCVLVAHDPERDLTLDGHRSWRVHASSGGFERLGRSR
jgi:galactokinase